MAKVRSPNFPVIDLATAIDAVGKIYARESRGKFPQLSAATHLGYTSINGRSLGMFAALRAYGLIEGRGDDLALTADAIALIEAPSDSEDRAAALTRAFAGPPMFNRIQEKYPEPPSDQTLKWWLIQQGFTADGAVKASQIFLESRKLVTRIEWEYEQVTDLEREEQLAETMQDDPQMRAIFAEVGKSPPRREPQRDESNEGLAMGVHERVLQSGILSKEASYRVIVSGPVGTAEIDRLLKKLEMDKEILADPDPEPSQRLGRSLDEMLG
jgi:hypothetical protein